MDDKPIKILLIEDSLFSIRHIQNMLAEAKGGQLDVELKCADRLSVGLEHLAENGVDVVLLDLTLPDSHELDTFTKAYAQADGVPIVVMSGIEDET
ncbi:MAG: response regulator, partial [Thermodesulfobacteriota bacterium]